MNIKSIRRNYENLTMLERLSLIDKATSRDDESEIKAIVAASPRETFSQTDFYNLLEKIHKFRLCNLIARLGYAMQFEFFLQLEFEENERIENNAKLAAYLYVRATDAWKAVEDELGLSSNFNDEIAEHLFSIEMLNRKDKFFREFAFTEDEAQKFIKAKAGIEKMQTIKDEMKAIREALDLPAK